MSKSRHAEAQIITALKQVEAGRTVEDVARDMAGSTHAETDTTASESCVWQAERNGESEQRRRSWKSREPWLHGAPSCDGTSARHQIKGLSQCESTRLPFPTIATSFALESGVTRKPVIFPSATCPSTVV